MSKIGLALFAGAAALVVAATMVGREHPAPPPGDVALTVTVVLPEPGALSETILARGVTAPREELQVMTTLNDVRVTDVLVEIGDRVSKGQTLARLEDAALSNEVARRRSDYEGARDAFAKADALLRKGAVTKQFVAERRSAMGSAKALLDAATLNLRRSAVTAPGDGTVFERNAVVGALVSRSAPLFRIAGGHEIEVEAWAPEAMLSALSPGQPASVTLAGAPTPIPGAVRRVASQIDAVARTGAIRINLGRATSIPVGLFAASQIQLQERVGSLLPRTAVQQGPTGAFVWVLDAGNVAGRLSVDVLAQRGDRALVSAISPLARVVARAGAFIDDGDRVRVAEGD